MRPPQYDGKLHGAFIRSLLEAVNSDPWLPPNTDMKIDTPTAVEHVRTLVARSESTKTFIPGQGSIDPRSVKMQGLLALFAIIGAVFVLGSIWFFFWAKNGGFVWRKNDWEEYKSTVLRRKGPDGKTLSNATKSTDLGGGSIVNRAYEDNDGYTEPGTGYGYTETATTISGKRPPKQKRNFREAARFKLLGRLNREKWEDAADDDVRAYRKEKPAKVGGINREADGTYHGSDYDSSNPMTDKNLSEMSEVRDYAYTYQQAAPVHDRRDFSFTPGTEDTLSQINDHGRIREPSSRRHNRRQERRRNGPVASQYTSPSKVDRRSIPGTYVEPLDFSPGGSRPNYEYSNVDTEENLGINSYRRPIPALSKGYRRDGGHCRRRDSLSDSDGEGTGYL